MEIQKGDYVTRKSYNNDTVFKVLNIQNGIYYLKGVDVRLYADSPIDDLVKVKTEEDREDYVERVKDKLLLDRDEYFYLPGKILHFDTDTQLSNKASNPYKIRENTNFKKYKKSQKKQKISNFS